MAAAASPPDMEFVALSKDGVKVYTLSPGAASLPSEPNYTFPAVPTADGGVWSSDGTLLGLAMQKTGGVTVRSAANDYTVVCEIAPLIGGPVRNFYFSPLGRFLVTHERYVKESGNNIGVWDARTGELKMSFVLKKMTDMCWPPLKWTNLETHCCRMVQDGVVIMAGDLEKGAPTDKVPLPPGRDILAFEVAPRGAGKSVAHVAVAIAEGKSCPAMCQTFRLDAPDTPTASKSFYKAQNVHMLWNSIGTALLVRASTETDDTGQNYYGGVNLYFMRPDGEEDCIVAAAADGPVHDVQWSPMQDEFMLLHGVLPCAATIHGGKKANKTVDFGKGHRNTIRFNSYGRFVAVGGYGQLLGDTDFWDKPGKTKLGSVRMECCVVSEWSPEGRNFLAATTHPRMRVDNKIVMYDYCGQALGSIPFGELMGASWRPMARGAFQDRAPSPERVQAKAKAAAGPAGAGRGEGYPGAAAQPSKQAYRPPGARGGGGLAEQLRRELGSTQTESSSVATKFGTANSRLPPGAAPADVKPAAGGGGDATSRNARRKKAKENAAAAGGDDDESSSKAVCAAPPPAKAAAVAETAQIARPAASADENPEVEKKVRALRKKLRDIEKLKEKPDNELDKLQREKLTGEAELIRQIRELGAEP